MTWWLRAHAVGASAVALAVCFVLAPLFSGSALDVPALFTGNAGSVSVPLLLPLVPACALLYGMDRPPHAMEDTAVRPLHRGQLTVLASAVCLGGLLAALESTLLDFPLALAVVRNLAGYLAVGLLVRRAFGPVYATAAVAAVPVACGLVGSGPGGGTRWWAWPQHDASSVPAAVEVGVLVLAAACFARTRRP
ncbi:hypothetical protein [Streptomyces iconiensis]|uniref:Integral membrane protein n=1 Tax=Streptomyces iconiensis TaxID=1384038 RepID=A0ABT7A781_9ACTN|nr:hypothetical protein [Streptomyces iconiensis]MDJ1136932.1 hypothetical protein [Streptomyces iconiensis]